MSNARKSLPAIALATGILVSGCGGNVANDAASRGATQNTGGMTSSGGGSTGIVSAQDAGRDASFNDPLCECGCGIFMPASCTGHIQVQQVARTPNILLVVDKSASLNDKLSDAGAQSRWDLNKHALAVTISLTKLRQNINFGLELFPFDSVGIGPNTTDPVEACQLPTGTAAIETEIVTDTDNVNTILDLLFQQNPGGYSPTAKALDAAYSYYATGNGRDLQGSKWVLLATDGATDCNASLSCGVGTCIPNVENDCPPNDGTVNCCASDGYLCSDDQSVVKAISKLSSAGIGTFVVGQPRSETEANYLNQFAKAGGVPNPAGSNGVSYYPITSADALPELVTALSSLITQLVTTCDIPLNMSGPIDPSSVLVAIDCNLISPVSPSEYSQLDAGGANGWVIDNSQSPPHLRLLGSICSNMETNGAALVDIAVGCPMPGSQ